MNRTIALVVALALTPSLFAADGSDPAIQYLLNRVETSTLTFVRNGKHVTGENLMDKLRKRGARYNEKIRSAEDFVRWTAARQQAKERYVVEVAPGRRLLLEDWLGAMLRDYRLMEPSGLTQGGEVTQPSRK